MEFQVHQGMSILSEYPKSKGLQSLLTELRVLCLQWYSKDFSHSRLLIFIKIVSFPSKMVPFQLHLKTFTLGYKAHL